MEGEGGKEEKYVVHAVAVTLIIRISHGSKRKANFHDHIGFRLSSFESYLSIPYLVQPKVV